MNSIVEKSEITNRPGKSRDGFGRILIFFLGALLLILALFGAYWYFYKNTYPRIPGAVSNGEKIITPTAEPASLHIPSLNVSAPFIKLALNRDRTIEVPKTEHKVGWFIYGAKPGDTGPAVVVGHLDSPKGPAVFQNLKNIKVGEEIKITRQDNSTVTYKVDAIEKYSQDNFPTEKVYGSIDFAGIRVITCSGYFDTKKGHYSENLIVFGHLES